MRLKKSTGPTQDAFTATKAATLKTSVITNSQHGGFFVHEVCRRFQAGSCCSYIYIHGIAITNKRLAAVKVPATSNFEGIRPTQNATGWLLPLRSPPSPKKVDVTITLSGSILALCIQNAISLRLAKTSRVIVLVCTAWTSETRHIRQPLCVLSQKPLLSHSSLLVICHLSRFFWNYYYWITHLRSAYNNKLHPLPLS